MKAVVKRVFPKNTNRGRMMRKLVRRDPSVGIQRVRSVLDAFAESHPQVVFVQIGSHDGETTDPIASYIDRFPGWTGVFVEPIPSLHAKLRIKRADVERFRVVQAAITERDGSVEMTTVDATGDVPGWTSKISSLDEAVVMRHERHIPGLTDRIRKVVVPAMTFATLTRDLTRIDLIHLDTEGHDAIILDQVDLLQWRPGVVLYEHTHLTSLDQERCVRRLGDAGYATTSSQYDTIAVRRD